MLIGGGDQPDHPAGLAGLHPAAAERSRSAMPGWPARPLPTRRARGVGRGGGAAARASAAAACLPLLRFDTNPLNLRNPKTEAVATFRDLMRAPETTPNTIHAWPRPACRRGAGAAAGGAAGGGRHGDPGGLRAGRQAAKLALIQRRRRPAGPDAGAAESPRPPPDARPGRRPRPAAAALAGRAGGGRRRGGPAAPRRWTASGRPKRPARRASGWPRRCCPASAPRWRRCARPCRPAGDARHLPDSLRRTGSPPTAGPGWRCRPRDLSDHSDAMARFARAVQAVVPDATGPAISVQASAETIGDAFLRAGVIATGLTVLLLVVALRSCPAGAAGAGAAGPGGAADHGDLRGDRAAAEPGQHHRPAAALRPGGRLQDLLRRRLAAGERALLALRARRGRWSTAR